MRALSCVLFSLLACACDCAEDPPRLTPAPAAPEPIDEARAIAGAVDDTALPPATRTDLPPASPAIAVRIEGRRVVVSNARLLETWPPAERARLAGTRPPDAPESWPLVEADLELPEDDQLRIATLATALTRAASVERARSASGAPSAFALRVTGASPWWSVVRVLSAAGAAGLDEPRFVLTSGRDEVELRLPFPRPRREGPAPRDVAALTAAIQRALAAQRPPGSEPSASEPRLEPPGADPLAHEPSESPSAPASTETTSAGAIRVRLAGEGLRVWRGVEPLGAGCQRPAISEAPSIPMSNLTRTTARNCLVVAGSSTAPVVFEADRTIAFARVATILEVLDELGTVSIGVTP